MPGDPRLRASDADRDRTSSLLREHHAVGRLTAEEFEERLGKVFAARTLGELDELLADLPAIDLYQLPSAGIRRQRRGGSGLERRAEDGMLPARTMPWIAWAAGSALIIALWVAVGILVGGAAWIPWFMLVIIPWRVALGRRPQEP
jgi:Domain of unknown function (DUF1707)